MGALITLVVIGISFGIGVFILMLEMGDGSPRKTAASDDYEGYKPMPFRRMETILILLSLYMS
mgnify:CR=1 FL=1